MALDFFGMNAPSRREAVWWCDPSVDWEATPAPDRAAYYQSGEARYLRFKPGASPTVFRLRALTAHERAVIDSITRPIADGEVHNNWSDRLLWAFAVGADFDLPAPKGDDGTADTSKVALGGSRTVPKHERHEGLTCLSEAVLHAVLKRFGDELYKFLGGLVWRGSTMRDDDFLASSPGSTDANSATAGTNGGSAPSATTAPTVTAVSGTVQTSDSPTPPPPEHA